MLIIPLQTPFLQVENGPPLHQTTSSATSTGNVQAYDDPWNALHGLHLSGHKLGELPTLDGEHETSH